LAPGQEHTLDTSSTKHVISAGDDNPLSNTVTASGQPPAGDRVEDTATVEVNWHAGNPSLKVYKWADVNKATVGDTITYTIKVKNTGDVTLTDVVIKDPMLGLDTVVNSLAPGASHTVDAAQTQYVVKESDLPGPLSNTVNVTAQPPVGDPISAKAKAKVNLYALPGLKVTKTAHRQRATVGNEVQFTITVKNTGNVTLKNIKVNDPMLGIVDQIIAELAPGAETQLHGSYTVQEQDVAKGYLINIASAKAKYGKKNISDTGFAKVKLYAKRGIELVKEAELVGGLEAGTVGDIVKYTLTVTNTGNVALSNVTVTDDMLGIDENIGTLAAGASHEIVRYYTITVDDVLNARLWDGDGYLHNTATAEGWNGNKKVTDSDAAAVPVDLITGIDITKTAEGSNFQVNQEVTFTVTVTNTGNVPLGWVDLSDIYDPADLEFLSMVDENGNTVDPYHEPGTLFWDLDELQPGESAEYKLTFRVLRTGTIVNEASAHGSMPDESELGDPVWDAAEIQVGARRTGGGGVPPSTDVQDTQDEADEVAEEADEPLAGVEEQAVEEFDAVVTELEQPQAGPDLPRTGGSVLPYIVLGLALIAGGVALRRTWGLN
ncbi:MAG TPA: DUF11 domain-containing protein, partial [Sphingobacteriaceae bacterium]|nr:DUF11 domain-containing protein [Sphingobacteriaceae bacterium]